MSGYTYRSSGTSCSGSGTPCLPASSTTVAAWIDPIRWRWRLTFGIAFRNSCMSIPRTRPLPVVAVPFRPVPSLGRDHATAPQGSERRAASPRERGAPFEELLGRLLSVRRDTCDVGREDVASVHEMPAAHPDVGHVAGVRREHEVRGDVEVP